jgi:tetratricopeptide (TPR) repeat protein/tRNA A-37 threonylcarbamoyl transferase component Bud32
MNCPDDSTLWALATGALSEAARTSAEAHLDGCADCRAAFAALARLQAPGARAPAVRARGATLGRYFVVDAVGAGGMGVVYSAFDPELDRKVALKLVRTAGVRDQARLRERLAREARLLARISHPNVVAIYDVGVVGDEVFLAMEFIAGPTLAAWQTERNRDWQEILGLYLQAARGLAQAHQAGVVHRDFKASNALLGPDGRVRVVDFGLAHTDDLLPEAAGPEGHVPEDMLDETDNPAQRDRLTTQGAVLGTPAYMAPEQRLGRPADARSDQYSLCVALHEALLGVRPSSDSTAPGPGASTSPVAGEPRKIPRWLRRVLQRGLMLDPAARWPDMHALIAACERGRRGRRGRALALAATLGAAGLATGLLLHEPPPPPTLCQAAAAELAEAWNDPRRLEIAAQFDADPHRYARTTWTTAAAALDAHAAAWTDAHTRICEATRVYGHQSEADMDRRMRCLDDRRAELRQTVDLLARGEPEVMQRAVTLVYGLPDPSACVTRITRADDDSIDHDDPRVRHVRDRIAEAAALVRGGRYADARTRLADPLALADKHAWHALRADGQTTLAEALEQLGEPAAAEEALYRAVWAAQAARDDARDATAWTRMAPLLAEKLARAAEGRRALAHARAALERHGPEPALTATLRASEAAVALVEGDFTGARDILAAELASSPFSADDPRLIKPISNYGVSLYMLGEHPAAAEQYRRAMAIAEPRLGPDHPEVGNLANNLGNALFALDQLDAAEAQQQRAVGIFRASLGPGHPSTAGALANLASIAVMRGQTGLAVTRYDEVLQILAAQPTPHPDEARVAYNLGACQIRMQQPEAALASFERAVAAQRRNHVPGHADLGAHLTGVGIAHVERGHPEDGIAPLEEAINILAASPRDPLYLAQARFELARALWLSDRDRDRARALARDARQIYSEQPGGDRFRLEVEAWIAAH